MNDVPMMIRDGAAAFHVRTDASSPITTAVTLSRSHSPSTAFMYSSGDADGCNGSAQSCVAQPFVASGPLGSDATNPDGQGHIGLPPGSPPNVCTWMSMTGGRRPMSFWADAGAGFAVRQAAATAAMATSERCELRKVGSVVGMS